jgi:hypothetical protein
MGWGTTLGLTNPFCPRGMSVATTTWCEPVAQTLPAVTVDRSRQKVFLMPVPTRTATSLLALVSFAGW